MTDRLGTGLLERSIWRWYGMQLRPDSIDVQTGNTVARTLQDFHRLHGKFQHAEYVTS